MPVAMRELNAMDARRLNGTGCNDRRTPGRRLRVQNGDRVDVVDFADALRFTTARAERTRQPPPRSLFTRYNAPVSI
jgi:hypothetical protein